MKISNVDIQEMIIQYKNEGREKEIHKEIERRKLQQNPQLKALAYLENELFYDYLHDMKIVQEFAMLNRKIMMQEILTFLKVDVVDSFTTIHNYIDLEHRILRKGAVSALKDEKLLIPINMRDGSLICVGKGNPDWNYSAPHGAGRLLSRNQAKRTLSLQEYKEAMKGIYSTCISIETIDEAPMAYKNMEDIIDNIQDTVTIETIIKPIYNFKASEEKRR